MPYNPGTQYRGDAYTFQGGQNAATAISGWLENFLNQQKQINAAGKAADSFVNAYQPAAKGATNPVLNAMGVHPDEWANLGAREKAARVHGYNQAKTLQDAGEEVTARINEHVARAKAAADEETRRSATAAGATDFINNLPGATAGTGTSGMDPRLAALFAKWNVKPPAMPQADNITQQLIAAARKTAAANPAYSPELVRELMPQLRAAGGEDSSLYTVKEGKTSSGTPYTTYGHQFNFDPSAVADKRLEGQKSLNSEREAARGQITPEKLLSSYQTDMKNLALDITLPPDQRATMRAELQDKIDALRGGASAPASQPNVTQAEYEKLKKGELFWWNGKQIPKQ